MDGAGGTRIAAHSCLVLGGARSGKSAYAQGLAEADGRAPVYLATAETYDDEMRARVATHRAERDARWRTVEARLGLVEALERLCGPDTIVLVDCLTLWLTNTMLADHDLGRATQALAAAVPRLAGPAIFVSNEVGGGIVPDNRMARDFRDAQGRLNQAMAHACAAAVQVTAGLPILLKPAPCIRFDFSSPGRRA